VSGPKSQIGKFREAALDLECHHDAGCLKEHAGKLFKHQPVGEPE
jgi:hypothetical protein